MTTTIAPSPTLEVKERIATLCKVLEERTPASPLTIRFVAEEGRKYTRIFREESSGDKVVAKSVHCFIERATGNVYKAASYKVPAKGIRYNLLDQESYEMVLRVADPYTSYLYRH